MTSHEDYRRKLWNKLKRVNGAVMAESNIVGWRGTGRWAKRLSLPSSKSGLIDRRNRIEFSLALLFFFPGPCYPLFIEASTTCSSFGAGEKREPMRRSSYRQFGYLWRIHWSLSARVCVPCICISIVLCAYRIQIPFWKWMRWKCFLARRSGVPPRGESNYNIADAWLYSVFNYLMCTRSLAPASLLTFRLDWPSVLPSHLVLLLLIFFFSSFHPTPNCTRDDAHSWPRFRLLFPANAQHAAGSGISFGAAFRAGDEGKSSFCVGGADSSSSKSFVVYIYIYIYIYNTSAHRKTIMLPVVVLAARKVAAVATITTHTTSTFLANSEEEEKRFRVFQSFVEPPLWRRARLLAWLVFTLGRQSSGREIKEPYWSWTK